MYNRARTPYSVSVHAGLGSGSGSNPDVNVRTSLKSRHPATWVMISAPHNPPPSTAGTNLAYGGGVRDLTREPAALLVQSTVRTTVPHSASAATWSRLTKLGHI